MRGEIGGQSKLLEVLDRQLGEHIDWSVKQQENTQKHEECVALKLEKIDKRVSYIEFKFAAVAFVVFFLTDHLDTIMRVAKTAFVGVAVAAGL